MVNIEIGPNLLAAAPWLFMATATGAFVVAVAVSTLTANALTRRIHQQKGVDHANR